MLLVSSQAYGKLFWLSLCKLLQEAILSSSQLKSFRILTFGNASKQKTIQ